MFSSIERLILLSVKKRKLNSFFYRKMKLFYWAEL